MSFYLSLRNASLLVNAVIIKLTRRRDIKEGEVGEGLIRREGITQDEIGKGGFDGIYFCGFFPKLRFFAYFLHISLTLPESLATDLRWAGKGRAATRLEPKRWVQTARPKTSSYIYVLGGRERALPLAMPRKTSLGM
jgi:hypothetical protein